MVGARKIAALVALATPPSAAALRDNGDRGSGGGGAAVCVAVDDPVNLRALSAAASAAGVTLAVLVDLDVGMHRCGLPHHDVGAIVALCRLALELPAITLRGLMGCAAAAAVARRTPVVVALERLCTIRQQ